MFISIRDSIITSVFVLIARLRILKTWILNTNKNIVCYVGTNLGSRMASQHRQTQTHVQGVHVRLTYRANANITSK